LDNYLLKHEYIQHNFGIMGWIQLQKPSTWNSFSNYVTKRYNSNGSAS
jgi:hypothetical protein